MQINTDINIRVVDYPETAVWLPSPNPGVERRMLERTGEELARATTIVRYAPNSAFGNHRHDLGEEFLVLEGTFEDEHGSYPAGTYIRNPPGSGHTPKSPDGCLMFVKLRQFDPSDQAPVRVDTRTAEWYPGRVRGLSILPLHSFGTEHVALVHWEPNTRFTPHSHPGGEEIFVLNGEFADEHGRYPAGTWLRSPPWSRHQPYSDTGCTIYVKTGHL